MAKQQFDIVNLLKDKKALIKYILDTSGGKKIAECDGESRIPRKIKKAIKRPCARSKWIAKSKRFTNRMWRRYCERTMQPGQCQTLQARLLLYLTLTGCKYSWRNQTLKCEMPSGVKLMVFPVPKYASNFGLGKFSWYGAALYPYRKWDKVRYLDERAAMHLYKRLGEQIKNKVEELNNDCICKE